MSNDNLAALRRQAMALPLSPGVYLMKDAKGSIIYIGKAKALKNRVSQYFGSDARHDEKTRRMVAQVARFDYIVTDSEFEALILECSLIKQYQPKYNILLKDGRGYHYIRVSPPPFSRITAVMRKDEDGGDGGTYLGPYLSFYAVSQAVEEANRAFQLSTCTLPLERPPGGRRARPCLNHYIEQCCAPCAGRVSAAVYAERVAGAMELLTKGSAQMLALMERRMNDAAERQDFEKAALLRDRMTSLRRSVGKQKVMGSRIARQDVIATALGGGGDAAGKLCFEVFRFDKHALFDREHFLVDYTGEAAALPAARAEFLRRYYELRDAIPSHIAVDGEVEDHELLERLLGERAARRVHLFRPQKGEQAALLEMCRQNAAQRIADLSGLPRHRTGDAAALDELAKLLGLPRPPVRIECYDVSHTAGSHPVAGMVVFENGRPLKSDYRRFQIRDAAPGDDPGGLREVLSRRVAEYAAKREAGETGGFACLPDLLLLDGGKGQVAAVRPVIEAAGWDVPVFGLVKDDRHRTRAVAADGGEIAVNARRTVFTLLSAIQEEVHRFAIAYHRQKRGGALRTTALTGIDGVGDVRARALLRHFGSLKAIRGATAEELAAVKGVTRPVADAIVKALGGGQPEG